MTQEERNSIVQELKEYIDLKFEEMDFDGISNLGKIITKHLDIDVDADWDPYSGQSDHYHKVKVNWN